MTTKTTSYLLELHFKRPLFSSMKKLTSGDETHQFIRENIDSGLLNHKEFFWIILLTRSNTVLGMKEISSGKTHSTTISFIEIAQTAILANACGCILVHNHPSGNLNPSDSDDYITQRAEKVLNLIDITLIDHIIITEEGYYSFVQNDHIILS